MRLNDDQIRFYEENGYVILHGLFSPAEVRLLQTDAEMLRRPTRGHGDANVYEKDGTTLRAAWAVELDSEACRIALRMRRLLEPVQQLLGDTYLYQSRLNFKVAGSGDVFQWHQDYGSWVQDGVPNGGPHDMLSILVMLDDTGPESGPLRFIPASHDEGLIETEYDTTTTSYALHVVPDRIVERMSDNHPPVSCTGPAGTVVIFSGSLVHGSQKNTSKNDRRNLYFAYNRAGNLPTGEVRRKHANPYIMSRDTTPLVPCDDGLLADLANRRGFLEA